MRLPDTDPRNPKQPKFTKQQLRAQKALAAARDRSDSGRLSALGMPVRRTGAENLATSIERSRRIRRMTELARRGTSVARIRRHGTRDEEGLLEELAREEREEERRLEIAKLGLAPPLPQSVLKPKPRKKTS